MTYTLNITLEKTEETITGLDCIYLYSKEIKGQAPSVWQKNDIFFFTQSTVAVQFHWCNLQSGTCKSGCVAMYVKTTFVFCDYNCSFCHGANIINIM